MSGSVHRFRIGDFRCTAISDGNLTYAVPVFPPPPTLLFANAPREGLEAAARSHGLSPDTWVEWNSPYICLLVNTGDHVMLVDTGADGLAPTTGRLLENLQAEGVSPGDVDIVVLTHGHPDHIGGNTNSEGQLAFPSARYFMWKSEWNFWMSGEAERVLDEHTRSMLIGNAQKNLPPIQDRLEAVDAETEIASGIRALTAPGHTPGHMGLQITSGGDSLLCIADTVLHPIHLEHPEWHAAVDVDPRLNSVTRGALLHKASVEQSMVLAFHFPFPGLGHIVEKDQAWAWQPLKVDS